MPYYNKEFYFKESINSVLNQSYKNFELIIIFDDIPEKYEKFKTLIPKDKRIKIFKNKKNLGAGKSRNFGIKKSKGEFIAFIDSDDLWKKNKLSLQINFMQKNNYFFTYTHYKTFKLGNPVKKSVVAPSKFNFKSFIKNTSIGTSTMIVKRAKINNIKFSNTKICEDYYYKCQLLKRIGFAYCCPRFLTEYQIRKNSLQSNRIRNLYWIWKINKTLNRFNILKNLMSIFLISLNSLNKYGFR